MAAAYAMTFLEKRHRLDQKLYQGQLRPTFEAHLEIERGNVSADGPGK
jgi:hypothetical protein